MKITQFSLRNPLVVGALALALVFFGLYSYFNLGIGIVPNISFPVVAVTTTDAGADPATIETQVTKPLEDALSALPNIDTMTSTSSEGVSSISVQFTTAANSDLVPVDVERVVNSVRSKLPANADAPSINKFDTSAIPVIVVAISGPQPLDQIQTVAQDRVQREFEALKDVGSVQLAGGQTPEIQIQADLNKLQARGLGLNSIQLAVQGEQLQAPAGSLTAATKDVNVRLNGLVSDPAQLAKIVVAQTAQGPVYLGDVATIDNTFKTMNVISRVNGVPAVTITVTKLNTGNTIAVSQEVRQSMAQIAPSLPRGMHMDVVFDAATYTQQSFNTIQKTLIEAVFFTGLILLLFLHTWRSTLIVLIAIPTSVLTTFGLMNLLGLNLNLFSMLALTLSVGILVDDSIVVLENIYRHLGLREPPFLAAINGRSEIGLAAITITMVDVVVYLPIALIPGIAGEFIRPFALVIASATLTSLAVSFTLTPLLASRYLTLELALQQGSSGLQRFGRWWDAGLERVALFYQRVLHGVLTRRGMRWVVIAVGLLSFVGGASLLGTGRIGFDIFPSGDQSEVDVTLVMPSGTTLAQTDDVTKQIEQRLKAFKDIKIVQTVVGGSSTGFGGPAGDSAILRVLLVPPTQRAVSSATLSEQMRQTLGKNIPGAQVRVGLPNAFGFGGFGGQPIQVAVRGPNPDVLNKLVDDVTAAVKSAPGAVDVNNANENVQPEVVINVNRDQAAALGVTAQQAASALRTAVDGTVVSTYQRPGQDAVDIRLMADSAFQANLSNLPNLPLLTASGSIVSLGQIGTIVSGTAPTQINHVDRERSVTVNASTSGRLVGDVQNAVEARVNKIPLAPGYSIQYGGQAQMGGQAFSDIYKAMAIALVLMYVLMMLLFGSVTLPLAVLMSLPLAVVGSFGAMAITATPFTLFSLLGFTLLIGLVGKNAILLVDYTDTLRKRGETRTQALLEAGPIRLRPILMTTLSVMVALAPVAAGIEEGSELLKAAAVVLIGGLITSTLLTLVFVPAMYTIFDDIQNRLVRGIRRFSKPRTLTPEEEEILHPHGTNGYGLATATAHHLDGGATIEAASAQAEQSPVA